MAILTLTGCQSVRKGLTPAQIAVLKQQGFKLTDEGWAFGLSGKVLFGSDIDSLNPQSTAIVERIGKALLGVGSSASGRRSYRCLRQRSL
jgi:outer membrane protein OmpA-like peptidoglycan-associated protein